MNKKFTRSIRGYDPSEVNSFLDKIIANVEKIVAENKVKDEKINELEGKLNGYDSLIARLKQYQNTEESLNNAIMMAQKTSDQMRLAAQQERESIVAEAKRNANRIVNEALIKAEKTENEALMLKRNINVFKRRLKEIVESQLEVVEEIERIEFWKRKLSFYLTKKVDMI